MSDAVEESTSPAEAAPLVEEDFDPAALPPAPIPEESKEETIKSGTIVEIEFSGNTLNKSRSLKRKVKSKEKQPLDLQKLQEDVKILFETGDFEDVEVSLERMPPSRKIPDPIRVTYRVKERAIIKRIDFKGNKKVKSSEFLSDLQSEEGAPFDRFKASLDERVILEKYRNEGYANAKVEHYTSLDPRKKQLILTFFITEGERVIVKAVNIAGTEYFKEKKIYKQMKSRRKKVFRSEILEQDRAKILDFYQNRGFLDAEVSTPTIHIDEERNEATINLSMYEGPRYEVGNVNFEGATIFSEKELQKAVQMKKGKLFRQRRLSETVQKISELYADKGYLRTEVNAEPERNPDEGQVDFTIDIEESSVVYVDGIYVDGNTYTKTYVIEREVLLSPGDIFSAGRMRRSVEKIYNLGFLDDVQVDVQQPRSPDLADLIFTVKEGKPGIFSAGAGFSSVDRFVGTLQVQHTNLFGRAQRVNASYEFGGRRQVFDIGWTDPWFLGYRMSGGFDIFDTIRRRDYGDDRNSYREKRRGAAFRLGPRITDDLGLLFSYTLQTTEVFDVEGDIKENLFPSYGVPESEAAFTDSIRQVKSSFVTEISYDTRDNRFDATRGSRNSLSVEVAGGPYGGDINFYKPQFSSAWFFPTFWKFVLSVNARGAWATHFSPSEDVPFSERYFLGGADTIRGYRQDSIAPRVTGIDSNGFTTYDEIPGRIYSIFNVEYKFPIVQERNRTIFQGALFLDVGGTWLRTGDIDLTTGTGDNQMKAGVGFGFRFKTPVFPIRLDFGYPLNPRPSDNLRQGDSNSLQTYFTIGNIF